MGGLDVSDERIAPKAVLDTGGVARPSPFGGEDWHFSDWRVVFESWASVFGSPLSSLTEKSARSDSSLPMSVNVDEGVRQCEFDRVLAQPVKGQCLADHSRRSIWQLVGSMSDFIGIGVLPRIASMLFEVSDLKHPILLADRLLQKGARLVLVSGRCMFVHTGKPIPVLDTTECARLSFDPGHVATQLSWRCFQFVANVVARPEKKGIFTSSRGCFRSTRRTETRSRESWRTRTALSSSGATPTWSLLSFL